jgi:phosphatidylglycerophosphate synthase
MPHNPAGSARSGWILEGAPDTQAIRIWSLGAAERQRRLLARSGCDPIASLAEGEEPAEPRTPSVMIARADAILDERLVQGLAAASNTLLVADRRRNGGWGGPVAAHVDAKRAADAIEALRGAMRRDAREASAVEERALASGLRVAAPADLAGSYSAALRKLDPPFVFPMRAENVREIEDRIFQSSYKGVTDLVTKWVWPRPAAAAVRALARARVQPNAVTALSWLLALACGALFWIGEFGWGLAVGWLMTFLDTVDGKLARVTLTSSRFGHVFDHALDLIHPPFWYLAWGVGASGGIDGAAIAVIAGYLLGRALEGIFIAAFGIETHCWRPIDSLFRTVTARRNPNLLLLSVAALGGRPDLGLVMVAIWTFASAAFHVERIAQALYERSRGVRIESWDAASESGTPGAQRDAQAGQERAG